MREPTQASSVEPRWPVALAVLAVLYLLVELPGRIRILPVWCVYAGAVVVLVPMGAVWLTGGEARWLRVERAITLLFVLGGGLGNLANLAHLISAMVHRPTEVSGLQLLTSSVGVWVTNVLVFSLLYWQMDRGSPEARASNAGTRPDWLFPQTEVPEDAPPNWHPTFVDYLSLGFSTATAFSPTDAMPLTSRAKLLMMLQSLISLLTIVVVASRAINILGS